MSSLSSQHGGWMGRTYLPGPTLPTPHSSRVPTMTLHASTCLSYQDVPWTRVVHPHQTSSVRPMFPVTRQVRRKRTRVSGRRGSVRRPPARARGSTGENCRGELGSTRTKGGLGGQTAWGDREGLGRQRGLGGAKGWTRRRKR